MPSKHLKTFFSFIFAVILTLGLSISFQSLLAAYTAPLVNPSGCTFGNPGCDAPINVGPANQSKAGSLGVVGAFIVSDNSYFIGKVGIGIAVANYKLDVQGGQINSSGGFCIAGDCKTAWSQVGLQSETDPTVPDWAKAASKPAYSFSEISGAVTNEQVPDDITINYAGSAGSATNFSGSLSGDITGTQSATVVGDNSHSHTAGTISGLGVADFSSANISQWTNNSGYITADTKWNGDSTGLVVATGRTSLGLNTLASAALACANGQIAKYNGTNWACANDNSGASYSAGTGLSLSGTTFSLNLANANTWTGAQTFSGQINATGGLCINGDCKSSWSQAGATSERIVQKVTRNGTWPGYNCATASGDTADGNPCSQNLYKCTRDDAINNKSYTDIFGYNGWDASDTIQCSMEYTSDSGNSIQIELNEPSNTYWGCADYNLQGYCGDSDGCRVVYMGQHKTDDTTRVIENFIYMEQTGWSSNAGVGLYGYTRQDGGEYGWINGDGTGDVIMGPWAWTYMLNYYHSYCGGNSAAFSDPYVFRFITHPVVHSKYIIYDKP